MRRSQTTGESCQSDLHRLRHSSTSTSPAGRRPLQTGRRYLRTDLQGLARRMKELLRSVSSFYSCGHSYRLLAGPERKIPRVLPFFVPRWSQMTIFSPLRCLLIHFSSYWQLMHFVKISHSSPLLAGILWPRPFGFPKSIQGQTVQNVNSIQRCGYSLF